MTWDDLAKQVAQMTSEQRETDVTVYVRGNDEAYKVGEMSESGAGAYGDPCGGVLDDGHPFLITSFDSFLP